MWKNRTLYFVAFFIVFPTAVSYVYPTKNRRIHINNMESIMIIIRKKIWLIGRDAQSNKISFRGNLDMSWEQIWDTSGSFMWTEYIIKDNGR